MLESIGLTNAIGAAVIAVWLCFAVVIVIWR